MWCLRSFGTWSFRLTFLHNRWVQFWHSTWYNLLFAWSPWSCSAIRPTWLIRTLWSSAEAVNTSRCSLCPVSWLSTGLAFGTCFAYTNWGSCDSKRAWHWRQIAGITRKFSGSTETCAAFGKFRTKTTPSLPGTNGEAWKSWMWKQVLQSFLHGHYVIITIIYAHI